ncbi:MAG: protein-glutamate O-methyltransferase CheR [Alphaproteobacteria bacterium]|nr:protein-glutamate O-methyltransferase CheR [Alphaproteobacteria bacterium]MBU1517266.1 protein-glutamate O-methyltransferase CheR [Alphaproteobacteria bacterium]MBU2093198.1 protein-glutamate O-methyltransferase CheR [Alphaproteobacteria bacterium]MBU2154231.1 protein-glutamate O-methyltransferase CheR [Alphaproteobacteria bacterium]MBU2305862.1 protein-glutamate O-methyltransferase CheR [Alphaproteobacteria bacterium]
MIPLLDLSFISTLCLTRAGLKVDAEKAYLIESRLAPLARRECFSSTEAFIDALRHGVDDRLAWAAVEAMALPESEFFRDHHVFSQLADDVVPALARARGGEPVRIWSAGCGTGQEIYSLTMLLADAPGLKVELFASDLSERSLEKAQSGRYSQFEVQRGLPARMLVRHFEKDGESFALSPRVRQMVRWRRVNLMDDLARVGQFDLILCRNVVGQLAPEAGVHVLGALHDALAPGGFLALGQNDSAGKAFVRAAPDLSLYAATGQAARSAA